RTITVHSVPRLGGVRYRPIPDRIEAGTLMLAAAATRGRLTLTDVRPEHLTAIIDALGATGVQIEQTATTLSLDASGPLVPTDIEAAEYPGVPTDLQAPFSAYLATIKGVSTMRDTIYPPRFTHVEELARAGADLRLNQRVHAVRGGELRGAAMHAADIRAGGALIIAALAAAGGSEVGGLRYVDRGYENLSERLASLGAQVERKTLPVLKATGTFGD